MGDGEAGFPVSASVYSIVELVGSSDRSWQHAASAALDRASKSLRELRIVEVGGFDIKLGDDGALIYRARVTASFRYETAGLPELDRRRAGARRPP